MDKSSPAKILPYDVQNYEDIKTASENPVLTIYSLLTLLSYRWPTTNYTFLVLFTQGGILRTIQRLITVFQARDFINETLCPFFMCETKSLQNSWFIV